MDQLDFDLLERIERGSQIFKPADKSPEEQVRIHQLVKDLQRLRSIGLIRFLDGRIMRAEDGSYLMVGPCDLTPEGLAALARDRSLGPRSPERRPDRAG